MQIICPANNISGLLFYYGAFCQSVKAATRCGLWMRTGILNNLFLLNLTVS